MTTNQIMQTMIRTVTLQDAADRLNNFGINLSAQRIAIMRYLMGSRIHPTAEMVYEALRPSMPTLSLTTIYNTLRLMVEKGALRVLNGDPCMTRYDVNMNEHAHFYCRQCGKIIDLEFDMDEFRFAMNLSHLQVEDFELSVRGLCDVCKESD